MLSFESSHEADQRLTCDVFNVDGVTVGAKFARVASFARCSLFWLAIMEDLLEKLQEARCLLSPRLSVARSQVQP
jgi:hypothetical protein